MEMKNKITLEVGILPPIGAIGGCFGHLHNVESLPMLDLADFVVTRNSNLKFEISGTCTRASKSTHHKRVPPRRHSLDTT